MRTVVPSRLPLWVADMQGYENTSWLACGYIETQCTPYSVTLYIVLYRTWTVARYMEHAGWHKSNGAVGGGTPLPVFWYLINQVVGILLSGVSSARLFFY